MGAFGPAKELAQSYMDKELAKARAMSQPPPQLPDLTDRAVQAAGNARLAGLGRGRKSTFLGAESTVPATQKTLLGGG